MNSPPSHEHFISLFERNLGIILKIARAYTRTFQDREDLVNDIAYAIWKAFPGFRGQSKVSTWIYRIALNTAMNYQRNTRKNSEFLKEAIVMDTNEPADDPGTDPRIEILYDCITGLDAYSKAIILLYLDGYRHEEIAEITGISKSNVGTRISRIKVQLKNIAHSKQTDYGI